MAYCDFEFYEQFEKEEAIKILKEISNDIYKKHFPDKRYNRTNHEYDMHKLFQVNSYLFKHYVDKKEN